MNYNCYSPERKKRTLESASVAEHYKRQHGVKDQYSNVAGERERNK